MVICFDVYTMNSALKMYTCISLICTWNVLATRLFLPHEAALFPIFYYI